MNLIVLTDYYPISYGEFFIDDELRIIANKFEKITVVVNGQNPAGLKRYIPENIEIIKYELKINVFEKLQIIPSLFTSLVKDEIRQEIRNFKISYYLLFFKIMLIELAKAKKIEKLLINIINSKKIDLDNHIFYSYWLDYKALALAILRKNKNIKCVSRAHGWDIFKERHSFPYLPFKKFTINNLSKTIFISNDGYKYFENIFEKLKHKLTVSKLGKINKRNINLNKINTKFLICSCSFMRHDKRIDLIIDVLKKINNIEFLWVHFGTGPIESEIKRYAYSKLDNHKFLFKGMVSNHEILDFYESNYVDLFVNLSEAEGIPVSIMEALSAGIPVLATNVGGTNEIVSNDHGFLIEKDFDIDIVAKIMEDFLISSKDNKTKYRKNAYKFWYENFNAEKNYSKFVDILYGLPD